MWQKNPAGRNICSVGIVQQGGRGRVGRVGWTAAEVSVTSTSIGTLVLQLYWDTIRLVGRRNKGTTGTSTVWEKIARVMAQTILCLAVVQW